MADISLSGLVSGLDWESLVQKLMAVDRQPLLDLEKRQKTVDEKKSAWKDINNRLYSLQTRSEALKSLDTFYSKKVESSDSLVLSATATSAVSAGAYTVEVAQLAKAHTVGSAAQSSSTAALNLVGAGVTANSTINGKTIAITSDDSLTSIRDKINGTPDIGVTASIVQVNASEYKLVLMSKETGAAKAMTIADDQDALLSLGLLVDDGTIHANTLQAAQDAMVKVNSVSITRSTNTITDAVSGLTLNLKQEGKAATLTVSGDMDKAINAVKAFVDQYNSAMDLMASKAAWDKDKKVGGPLLGDSTLSSLQAMLRQKVSARIPGLPTSMNNLTAIGITTGAFGSADANKLTVDETKLRENLEANLDDVARLFGATPVNVALGTSGATATAVDGTGSPNESAPPSIYGAANAINGDVLSDRWGTAGGGWMDATPGVYPDILEIDFGSVKTIDRINLWTLNSATYEAATYGVRDYKVQYHNGTDWVDIETVTGNTLGIKIHQFDPVNTQKIRINVTATNGSDDYSRIVEVEAFQYNEGIGSSLYRSLKDYTRSGGILPEKQESLDAERKRLSDRIDRAEQRLTLREETLKKQFLAMETAIARLKSQGDWLTAQINQMSGWYSGS